MHTPRLRQLLAGQAVKDVDARFEVPCPARVVVGDHDEPIFVTVMRGNARDGAVVPVAEPYFPDLGQLGQTRKAGHGMHVSTILPRTTERTCVFPAADRALLTRG
jgi:hypothetical protein